MKDAALLLAAGILLLGINAPAFGAAAQDAGTLPETAIAQSARCIISGVLPRWTVIGSPAAFTFSRASAAWCGLKQAIANRTSGTFTRTKSAALRNHRRLCKTSWVREPGSIATSGLQVVPSPDTQWMGKE